MTTLSNLPRAALAAKEGYWWINAIAVVLSIVIAWMSLIAYNDLGQADHAMVCIVCQALAIALAILARRAITAQMPLAALGAFLLACGCAWWSSHGLALAWYDDAERNGEPMVIFMAALEPGLFLLAEHVREGREVLRVAHAKAEAEEREALARARERDALADRERAERLARDAAPRAPAPASNVVTFRKPAAAAKKRKPGAVRKIAAGVAAVSALGAALPAAAADAPAPISGAERVGNRAPTFDDIDRARYELRNRGIKPTDRTLSAHIGCSRHAIWRAWPQGEPLAFPEQV